MTKFRFSGLTSVLFLLFLERGLSQNQQDIQLVEQSINALNDVMIYDITSPPVASRNYAYSLVAFYEAVAPSSKDYKSYAGQLNGLETLPKISPDLAYDWLLAGMTAFYKTADSFVFSRQQFEQSWDSVDVRIREQRISDDVRERSVEFGEQVAAHIIAWAKADGFARMRSLPRFTPGKQPGSWQQTGPDYMEAIEPHWNSIRPMTLSRADQFLLREPALYNSKKFLEGCREVYETGQKLTSKQRAIANFWDCNPFATETVGHLRYSIKKLSPAGHWIGITGLAVKQKEQSLLEALYAYSLVSVAIFDAIILCWDEKYRSNYIRPVTAIQQLISPVWQPVLQTPPFPEYPSGHSVISTAAATVLSSIYGDGFHYIDDVEKPFGLPVCSFNSFFEAAHQAAISRLYGGIHFREAIENGEEMGRYAGDHVLENLELKVTRGKKRKNVTERYEPRTRQRRGSKLKL